MRDAFPEFVIFPNVQMSSFVRVKNDVSDEFIDIERYQQAFQIIENKSVDFLVCLKGDYRVIAAIEFKKASKTNDLVKRMKDFEVKRKILKKCEYLCSNFMTTRFFLANYLCLNSTI
jgi:hypothetical protein